MYLFEKNPKIPSISGRFNLDNDILLSTHGRRKPIISRIINNMSRINGKTEILAVFGDPIAHSLSPVMHNAAFQALGWNAVYIPCRVLPEYLPQAVEGIRAMGYRGANITIPHKQSVISCLDEVVGDAVLSGSVNTIIHRDGKLLGTSTDGIGLIRSLQEDGACEVAGKNVLLLGAGGSAAALVFRLIQSGIGSLTLVNRDPERALRLKAKLQETTGFQVHIASLAELERLEWGGYDLLINTTSVGLHDDQTLVSPRFLNPSMLVYDIVYKPGDTRLIRDARERGCRTVNGISLLLYQGAESFRWWFGEEPPLAVMREALNIGVSR